MCVYRRDLVASSLEQTAIKTKHFLEEHAGQTFIFEELLVFSGRDSFGKKALDTLNSLKSKYSIFLVFNNAVRNKNTPIDVRLLKV